MIAGVSGCAGGAAHGSVSGAASSGNDGKSTSPSASPTHPSGPPMEVESITPEPNVTTVGVAMPISVVFSKPVAQSARSTVERHLKVTTSTSVTGAWHWFSETRVDWRPEHFWSPGTKVKLDADLTDVSDGKGRYGKRNYQRSFTVGDDFRANVSVADHTMRVTKNGATVENFSVSTGSDEHRTWSGTMAVMDKQEKLRMTSCSVGSACHQGEKGFYDGIYQWDVHLTMSGVYVHYSNADPSPGSSSSHGCIHLSLSNAEWFYNQVKEGDPVTITGASDHKDDGQNGYAAFSLTWEKWLAGSATGQKTGEIH
ncbi:L,D-transpeptidase [Streptomyces sp. NPDC002537]